MDRYPDAPARIELLIDLTIWVAQASHSLLVTGKVRRVLQFDVAIRRMLIAPSCARHSIPHRARTTGENPPTIFATFLRRTL